MTEPCKVKEQSEIMHFVDKAQ